MEERNMAAIETIRGGSGSQFDPKLVETLVNLALNQDMLDDAHPLTKMHTPSPQIVEILAGGVHFINL